MPIFHQDWDYLNWDPTQKAQAGLGLTALGTLASMPFRGNKRKFRGYKKWMGHKRRKYMTRKSKRGTSGRGVTFEHDRQFIYRKKRMPRRRKRRWLSFKKKIQAADDSNLGTRSVLFNKRQAFSNQTDGNQLAKNICLYGWDSNATQATWHNDLAYIAKLENQGNPTAADGVSTGKDTKILFKSGVLDVTVRNTSYLTSTPETIETDLTLEVDVYEWTMRKEAEVDGGNEIAGENVFNNNKNQYAIKDNNGTPSTTIIDLNKRGSTPFDCTTALSTFGIRIIKKTKFFIRGGQTLTYQMRDPRNHTLDRNDLFTTTPGQSGFNYPKITRNVLFIAKSIPGFVLGNQAGQHTERLDFGVTRKYSYKMRGAMEDRSLYITN